MPIGFPRFLRECRLGDVELAKQEIAHQDLRQCNNTGWTALMMAAKAGRSELVALLLPGSDPEHGDNEDGSTALIHAAHQKHAEVVKVLLPFSERNHASTQGWTALMWACRWDNDGMFQALLPGSDLALVTEEGETALMIAARSGRASFVEALLNAGSNMDACRNDGKSAAMLAHDNGHKEVEAVLERMVLRATLEHTPASAVRPRARL